MMMMMMIDDDDDDNRINIYAREISSEL